jgi:uncharacterized protein (DUF342 family)
MFTNFDEGTHLKAPSALKKYNSRTSLIEKSQVEPKSVIKSPSKKGEESQKSLPKDSDSSDSSDDNLEL